MPGGGSTNTSTQTTSSGPWKPTQPYLKGAMGEAERLYDAKKGFHPFPGEGYVPFSSQSQNALGRMQSLASGGNPFYSGSANFTNSLISGGQRHDQSGFQNLMGQNPNAISQYGTDIASGQQSIAGGINPQLQGLMGQTPNALQQNVGGIASGVEGIGTEGDYRSLYNAVDPEFEGVVQRTANDLGDQIQRQFGGTAYGTPENAKYLTEGVGNVVSQMRSNNFNQNLSRRQGLLGDITGVQAGNIGNRLSAAGALSGEQGTGLAQRSGLLGQMGGFMGQDIANQLGAAGALSGEQQTGFGNTRGLLGDMSNLSQMDIQNRMGGLGMADSVYNSQYLPAERMLGVGGAYEGKSGEQLQAQMDKWNIKQMAPWDRLAQAYGMFSGTGAQGGRTQTQVSQPTDIWSKLLGGGLLASQMF